MGNMHTQFKFKHTVSVINGQKKLHFTHRVHPVGISRYIGTLPTKFHLVKAMVFPVVMYGCESWTLRKAEL